MRPDFPRFSRAHAAAMLGGASLAVPLIAGAAGTPEQVAFFEKEVKPILAENCFGCHGGKDDRGEVKVRSGFQAISRLGFTQGGDHGPAVDLEKPAESRVLAMLSYKDDDHQMPPKGKLEDAQIGAIAKWIEMGAPWTPGEEDTLVEVHGGRRDILKEIAEKSKSYWAYQPVQRPETPEGAHPVDALIDARLKANGLEPNPRGEKAALIRRAYYDLTGLPPSPEDVAAFAADESPDAWEALLDRLLKSPAFGERWARHWLDLVRYADSNGYERDAIKEEIWRYRDYVIRAFNDDKPYDEFIREQLAGDELAEVTADSIIATGFQRLHLWDDEPVDREQARYDNLDDVVRTTSEGFLAMSLGCARCHEHKIDPIKQEDYYSFMAFFNNVTPMGNNKNDRGTFRELDGLAADAEAVKKQREREARITELEQKLAKIEVFGARKLREKDPSLAAVAGGRFKAGDVLFADSREKPQTWLYTTETPAAEWKEVGFNPPLDGAWKEGRGGFGRAGTPGAVVGTPWDSSDIWLRGQFRLDAIPASLELDLHHDEDVEVYLNGQLVAEFKGYVREYEVHPLGPEAVAALQTGKNTLAIHCRQTGGGQFIDAGLRVGMGGGIDLADLVTQRAAEVFTPDQQRIYADLRAEIEGLRAETVNVEAGGMAMCVTERGSDAPPMHVHIRGMAGAKGDEVQPGFPVVLRPPQPQIRKPEGNKSTGRRLALANWITDEQNPLTARVMMNRVWQHLFGRGIVPTPNDFGGQGEQPTHPEVLDWLSAEFMRGDWQLKRMIKIIMLSDAYQRSSRANPASLEKDPTNQLFWRNDMRRLTAEEVRDSILALSGSLNRKMFGPPVFPELPAEVLATSSKGAGMWGKSPKDEGNRRSIYVIVRRSLLVPLLTDFDFADTDSPCAVRNLSTVPTQALNLLNSKFVNDQASDLAKRLRADSRDPAGQVRRGLTLATGRAPAADEVQSCVDFMKRLEAENGLTPEQSLERFALIALNLNEFIYLD